MKYFVLFFGIIIGVVSSTYVSPQEWQEYKLKYNKQYDSVTDNRRRLAYGRSAYLIKAHNLRFDRRLESFKLGINQFSDMSDLDYNRWLGYRYQDTIYKKPSTTFPPTAAPPAHPPLPSNDWTTIGAVTPVKDQGIFCNSAWAFAAIAALETQNFLNVGTLQSFSEQQLKDCTGLGEACSGKQTPLQAYKYIQSIQSINNAGAYPNNPNGQVGFCNPNTTDFGVALTDFKQLNNDDDSALKYIVSFTGAVVVGYNPFSFEFRHYNSGIFAQRKNLRQDFSKYYMAVVGYGIDSITKKEYWLLKNSMGISWGEMGYIKVEMNPLNPITKNAIYPLVA